MNPPETRLTLVEGGEVAHLKSEIDRLERTNRELIKQQTILGGEFAGLQHTIRKLSSENVALKGEQTRRQREAKNVEQETRVLEAWRTLTGHPRASILPEGRRAEVVREARELGHTDPPLPCRVHAFGPTPKDAVCSVWDELIEAVEGLALLPWAGPRGRCPAGTPGAKPYDGIEYALTSVSKKGRMADESVIERMRGVARQARRADPDVLLASWRHADAHARCCWELLVARLTRDRARWAHETRGTA